MAAGIATGVPEIFCGCHPFEAVICTSCMHVGLYSGVPFTVVLSRHTLPRDTEIILWRTQSHHGLPFVICAIRNQGSYWLPFASLADFVRDKLPVIPWVCTRTLPSWPFPGGCNHQRMALHLVAKAQR